MIRTLLVIDDYNEMIYLQTLLKKMGFDVDALSNSRKFADTLLGFNPKVIIMTAFGKKVDGLSLTNSIVKRSGFPKVYLIKGPGQLFTNGELNDEKIDKILESPVNNLNLIKAICEHETNLNFENLSNKLSNLLTSDKKDGNDNLDSAKCKNAFNEKEEIVHIKGSIVKSEVVGLSSKLSESERVVNYKNFLKKMEDPPEGVGGFDKNKIKEYNKKHRLPNRDETMRQLDEGKKNFVRALYSHLKKSS